MSFNTQGLGSQIAVVKSDIKKLNKKKIFFSEDVDDFLKPTTHLSLKDNQGNFLKDSNFEFFKPDLERIVFTILGSAGSGKSYVVAQYLKNWHKQFKDKQIYFFSQADVKDDPAFTKIIKSINQIPIDDSIITDPIPYTDFKDCMVVFDDVDALSPRLKKPIYQLAKELMNNSRKKKVSVIFTCHNLSGVDIQFALSEANAYCFFPKNYNRKCEYLLKNYLGLSLRQIEVIKNIKSRPIIYDRTTYPNSLIGEKDIMTLDFINQKINEKSKDI